MRSFFLFQICGCFGFIAAIDAGDHLVGWAASSLRWPSQLPLIGAPPGCGVVLEDPLQAGFHPHLLQHASCTSSPLNETATDANMAHAAPGAAQRKVVTVEDCQAKDSDQQAAVSMEDPTAADDDIQQDSGAHCCSCQAGDA